VSQQTKAFHISKKWTYLLYDEFFHQGDVEKERGLPVSFLCNRETTNVPKMQPGFINGITVPMFSVMQEIMPVLAQNTENAKRNCKTWEELFDS